jgi:ParB family chromosome partitioning protein
MATSAKVAKPVKSRLGRGLSSLISVSSPSDVEEVASPARTAPAPVMRSAEPAPQPPSPTGSPLDIPLADIVPNPHQPRRQFTDATIAELAASIRASGLIQPIVVRKAAGGYQLIAGERRWRAAKVAGLTAVPAIVRDVDSFTQAQMALVENIQREDLNPIDRALGYRALIDQLGLTQAELAGRLGEDRSSIANFLRLLELAEPVRTLLRDGKLSTGHAKLLAGISDILEQQRLAELVVSQGLSVRNLERLIQEQPVTPPPSKGGSTPTAHLQDLEKSLTRQLGMRVQVKSSAKKGKGKLVVHYSSLDQFDDLLGRLGIAAE